VPYRLIEDPGKLRRVLEATLLLEADLDLPTLLGHFIEEARSMTNARYGALGVLDESGTALSDFVTVGLEPHEEDLIGVRPTGRGVLGLLITDPKPLRLSRLGDDPMSYGFPPNHPPMTSFLGVPLKVRGEVYGNLYLTDKIGWSEFTADDEALVGALAVAAGIAVENARLHRRAREVAVYEERDRVARDLHDTVIQRLFAIGLSLQSMAGHSSGSDLADRLTTTIADVDTTIRQVRTTIFELGSGDVDQGARASVLTIAHELGPVLGFDVGVTFTGPVDSALPGTVTEHLVATLREALTNVGRHAHASRVDVEIRVEDVICILRVVDDGCGLGGSAPRQGGMGLTNMRGRAEKLRGEFTVESSESGGTVLTWQVPIAP
jgi:signal transduction histidine kinase